MDTSKKRLTPEEKLARLEKKVQKARAVVSKKNRDKRNGWLVSAGIVLEEKYKRLPEAEREKIRRWVDALDVGDARNRARFIEFLDHLEKKSGSPAVAVQHSSGGDTLADLTTGSVQQSSP